MEKEVAVVGIPRCGTTYVYRSICGLGPGSGTPKGEHYKKMPALKMHSLAPPDCFGDPHATDLFRHTAKGGRCIFIFGDPVLAVLSTSVHRWDHVHAENCGFFGDLCNANIYTQDCFHYEKMFDSWMQPHSFPTLAVYYDAIPEHYKEIEDFLGRKIDWIKWRPRKTHQMFFPHDTLSNIYMAYRRLINKVKEAPSLIIL